MVHSIVINKRDTYYPLESTVHISHIAQHAVAGERHAFLFEKTEVRRQKTECAERSWHAETAETTETRENPPSFRAQRSGVEKSFHTEASRREKNLTQITQIFTEFSVRRQIMLASERITRNREAELARRNSRNKGNTRHFERSGAESRNPFTQKHCEER